MIAKKLETTAENMKLYKFYNEKKKANILHFGRRILSLHFHAPLIIIIIIIIIDKKVKHGRI
jgi:hypothetical protein